MFSEFDKLLAFNSNSNGWPYLILTNAGFKKASGIVAIDVGEEVIPSPLIERILNSYFWPGDPPDKLELLEVGLNVERVIHSDSGSLRYSRAYLSSSMLSSIHSMVICPNHGALASIDWGGMGIADKLNSINSQ